MKSIRNISGMPLRITLPGGKVLHLGPKKIGQIADSAAERRSITDLVKAGKIEILPDAEHAEAGLNRGTPGPASNRGHHPRNKSHAGGDR